MNASPRALVLLSFLCGVACGNSKAQSESPRDRPVPVAVANVTQKDMPVEVGAVGTAEAVSTVEVMSQVGGLLMHVHFKEGDFVKRGALLFSIDTRAYSTALAAARAQLAKNEALAAQAKDEAERQERLQREGVGTQQELGRATANAAAQSAALESDRAQIRGASLNVQFAKITSPIDGRTGSLLVYPGNLVQANGSKPLVVIRSLTPIFVRFAVPERHLPEIRARLASGKLAVKATPRAPNAKAAQGWLTFVENSVDPATGTIALKAEFVNEAQELWPGQFVDVVLTLNVQSRATVVPQIAVQQGQDGTSIFVIEGNRAKLRKVEVSRQLGEEVVIQSGLTPGERVVTDGQIRLRDATLVSIKPGAVAPPRASGSEGESKPAIRTAL